MLYHPESAATGLEEITKVSALWNPWEDAADKLTDTVTNETSLQRAFDAKRARRNCSAYSL